MTSLDVICLLCLTVECGPNFTSKLEGMFKDIELSREMMSSFKQVIQTNTQYTCTCTCIHVYQSPAVVLCTCSIYQLPRESLDPLIYLSMC